MKKIHILFLFGFAFISCSDENRNTQSEEVLQPIIENINSSILFVGDTLKVEGENFMNSEFKTFLVLNNVEYEVAPLSDNKIEMVITDEFYYEINKVKVKVSDQFSNELSFFNHPVDWYLIDDRLEVENAYVFDESNTITLLRNTEELSSSYYGQIVKFVLTENGYELQYPSTGAGNIYGFKMYDENTGVVSTTVYGYFTTDGFETSLRYTGDLWDLPIYPGNRTEVTYVDENSAIFITNTSFHVKTDDQGQSVDYYDGYADEYFPSRNNIYAHGLASDGYHYQIGYEYGGTNLVMRSVNGFDNWEILDIETPYSASSNLKFFDTDLLLKVTDENDLYLSTDLMKSWTLIRENVREVFIKDHNTWYIVSDNTLFISNDAGVSWEFELEFLGM